MPIYEFSCKGKGCGHVQEVIIGISELSSAKRADYDLGILGITCKKCGGTKFKKLISAHGKNASNWGNWKNNIPKAPREQTYKKH